MPPRTLSHQIAQPALFGKPPRRAPLTLPPQKIHPVVRIAHRQHAALNVPPRIILDHELVLILKGAGRLITPAGPIPYAPHHLFFLEPFIPHAFESDGIVEHVAIHFDLAADVPPSTRLQKRPPYQVRLTQDLHFPTHLILAANDPIERWLLDVIFARARPGNLAVLAAATHLQRALVLLLERSELSDCSAAKQTAQPPATTDHIRIQRALDFLEKHLAEKLSAADLAAAADTSPSHFNRIFRQWSGASPMEFLRHRRIEKARQFLSDHDLSIKQIAAKTGFDDPFHFSRVFRQIDGLSPSHFRAAALATTSHRP